MKNHWSTRLLWLFAAFISGIAWLSPAFGIPSVVSRQQAILNTCDYDGGSLASAGYDGRHLFPAFNYGSAAVRISDREANQTAGTSGHFDKSSGFVAPETVANEGIYEFTSFSGKTYVGQSGDIAARIGQHVYSGMLLPEDLSSVQTTEVLGGKTAREVAEQLRINQLGGVQNLQNIRNPIGPARRHLLSPLP
jgi:hypothetical protein